MRKLIAELLYPEIFKDYKIQMKHKDDYKETIVGLNDECNKFKNENTDLKLQVDAVLIENTKLNKYLEELNAEILDLKLKELSPIDAYLESKYPIIPNIAYQQKRKSKDEYYSVYLNQMITPDSFEVLKFKQPFIKMLDNKYTFNFNIGNVLAKHTTWVDEQKLYDTGDYYFIITKDKTYRVKSGISFGKLANW